MLFPSICLLVPLRSFQGIFDGGPAHHAGWPCRHGGPAYHQGPLNGKTWELIEIEREIQYISSNQPKFAPVWWFPGCFFSGKKLPGTPDKAFSCVFAVSQRQLRI